jgi:resuscitation-promoting factor RpfA
MSNATESARRRALKQPHFRNRGTVLGPVLIAAVGGSIVLSATAASASSSWAELRQCESGGNYRTNTGNGYFGAYQFNQATWNSLGYSGKPSDAPPAVQDAAAQKLASERGFSPWPMCGRGMPASLATVSPGDANPPPASRTTERVSLTTASGATRAPGTVFTTAMAGTDRPDVRAWQTQMNKIGYKVAVDGRYGSRSAAACRQLQAAKGLLVDGEVGDRTWAATFA